MMNGTARGVVPPTTGLLALTGAVKSAEASSLIVGVPMDFVWASVGYSGSTTQLIVADRAELRIANIRDQLAAGSVGI